MEIRAEAGIGVRRHATVSINRMVRLLKQVVN